MITNDYTDLVPYDSTTTHIDAKATGPFDDRTIRLVGDFAKLSQRDNQWLDKLTSICDSRWAVRSAFELTSCLLYAELDAFPLTVDEAHWLVLAVNNQVLFPWFIKPLPSDLRYLIAYDPDFATEILDQHKQQDLIQRLEGTGLAFQQALRYAIALWWTNEPHNAERAGFEAVWLNII